MLSYSYADLNFQNELDQMKQMFMKEIHDVNEKYQASERVLNEMRSGKKRSNLGDLQDDDEEKGLLRQQREEVAMLKEQLQDQVRSYFKSKWLNCGVTFFFDI